MFYVYIYSFHEKVVFKSTSSTQSEKTKSTFEKMFKNKGLDKHFLKN